VDTIRNSITPPQERDDGIFEAFISRIEGHGSIQPWGRNVDIDSILLKPSDFTNVSELRSHLNRFFTTWHPLFPFLDGQQINGIFDTAATIHASNSGDVFSRSTPEQAVLSSIWLRAVFTIGGLGYGGKYPTIEVSEVWRMTSMVLDACDSSVLDDLSGVQALFAIQLSLYVGRHLRQASRLSGIILSESLPNTGS
jgi:hypothetical protein